MACSPLTRSIENTEICTSAAVQRLARRTISASAERLVGMTLVVSWSNQRAGCVRAVTIFANRPQYRIGLKIARFHGLFYTVVYRQKCVLSGVSARRGTTASDARRQVRVRGPTVSTAERASTSRRTSTTAAAPPRTSATRASSSTRAARRPASTAAGAPSSRASDTRAAVVPATAASTVASTTRAPAHRAFTVAAVPPSPTPPSGQPSRSCPVIRCRRHYLVS